MCAQVLRVMGLVASVALVLGASAQQPGSDSVYAHCEVMPEFIGGDDALFCILGKNVHYPDSAKARGVKGMVYVAFVVEADGAVSEVQVARGVDPLLDAEAVRVVRMMPRFKPGEQDGKAVRCNVHLPISFTN
jgi:protein TonB